MKRILLLFLILPILTQAVENQVPMGTKGNRLVFTVKNTSPIILNNIHVTVQSCPDWIVFDQTSFNVDSLPAKGKFDTEFAFQVANGEAGRTGEVRFSVADEKGSILARRSIQMKAILAANEIKLFPPYPNPANPSATIQYTLTEAGRVKMEICNVLGQTIRTLLDEEKPSGQWNITWDGKDNEERTVSSGIYMVRFQTTVKGKTNRLTSKIMIQR
jgi:hypothetical protein